MITKNQARTLYFLDRDSDLNELIEEIEKNRKIELLTFLETQQNRLQEKGPGEYLTLEDIVKVKEGELENMQRFFRGAVVPYFIRQNYDMWEYKIPSDIIEEGTNEIKKSVGFMKYDHTGHITTEVNSMATFERVKDLNQFLEMVEAVCFVDNGFIFPSSEHFKKLEKTKGRDAAQRQVFEELLEKTKNRFYKREIIK